MFVNPLPKNKILHWSKFTAFADEKNNVVKNLKFVLGRVENIVGKEENAGCQHFLLFALFQKASFTRSLKLRLCGKELRFQSACQGSLNACFCNENLFGGLKRILYGVLVYPLSNNKNLGLN